MMKESRIVSDDIQMVEVVKLTQSEKREQVFISLFIAGFYEDAERKEALKTYYGMQNFSEEVSALVYDRYTLVREQLGAIDTMLSQYAIGWDLNRIGKAEINILRLAVYEIVYDAEIPNKVAANEAVELAKKYGAAESYGFINGILGKVIANSNEPGV